MANGKMKKARELEDRYNMLNTGNTIRRNEVEIILDKAMKTKVLEAIRESKQIIAVNFILDASIVSVISMSARQVDYKCSLDA